MVWRKNYSTKIIHDIPIELEDGVWVGISSEAALGESGIWTRLLDQEGIKFRLIFLGDPAVIEPLIAPSLFRKLKPVNTVPFDTRDRSFAMVVQSTHAKVVMIGPPTEEAFDEFVEATRH